MTDANLVFATALRHHQSGELREADAGYAQVLALAPAHVGALHNRGIIALALGRPEIAADFFGRAIALQPAFPECHYHLGIACGALGRFAEAERHNRRAIELRPDYAEAHLNLGNALKAQARLDAALASYQRTLTLAPRSHLAHYNIANVFAELGNAREAVAHYRRAVELKPDYADAFNNLGTALGEQGDLDAAITAYRRAVTLAPRLQAAHINLGHVLRDLGDAGAALDAARAALGIAETHDAKALVYRALKAAAGPHLDRHQDLLIRAVTEHWGPRAALARAVVWLLRRDPLIVAAIERLEAGKSQELSLADLFGSSGIDRLVSNRLFHCLALLGRAPEPGLEALLTATRAALLKATQQSASGGALDDSLLSLAATVATLCFANEYVFACMTPERDMVDDLRRRIVATTGPGPSVLWLAAFAAYEPLHALPNIDGLLNLDWPDPIRHLLTQQVVTPRNVRARMEGIEKLTAIDDSVSLMVSRQYEENPYPQWQLAQSLQSPRTLQAHLHSLFPALRPKILEGDRPIDCLIAGCGTGQLVVQVVEQFSNINITAIDLSRPSLAYAMHMTAGIPGIRFAQADILKIGSIAERFDLIDATGVLHHLGSWETGWRSLLSVLRPRGLMRVGLYSEIARKSVVAARRFIAERGYSGTPDDIRRCRREIIDQPRDAGMASVVASWDFYGLSECRDLLFHFQESRLTLREIKRFLTENDLDLLGFEQDAAVMRRYDELFPDDRPRTNLDNWQAFEEQAPETFAGMYQFWVQRRV